MIEAAILPINDNSDFRELGSAAQVGSHSTNPQLKNSLGARALESLWSNYESHAANQHSDERLTDEQVKGRFSEFFVADGPEAPYYMDLVNALGGKKSGAKQMAAMYFVAKKKGALNKISSALTKDLGNVLGPFAGIATWLGTSVLRTGARILGYEQKLQKIEHKAQQSSLRQLASQLLEKPEYAKDSDVENVLRSVEKFGYANPDFVKGPSIIGMAQKEGFIDKTRAQELYASETAAVQNSSGKYLSPLDDEYYEFKPAQY